MSAQALAFYMRESAPKGDPLESPDLLVCPLPLVPKDLLVCWCALLSSTTIIANAMYRWRNAVHKFVYHVYRGFAPIRYTLLVHKYLPKDCGLWRAGRQSGTAVPAISYAKVNTIERRPSNVNHF